MTIPVSSLVEVFRFIRCDHDSASYAAFTDIFRAELLYFWSHRSVLKLDQRSCRAETLAYRIRAILDLLWSRDLAKAQPLKSRPQPKVLHVTLFLALCRFSD